MRHRIRTAIVLSGAIALQAWPSWGQELRYQLETKSGSGRYHTLFKKEAWDPEETAIIVCDVWDYHHCRNAVRRLEEFAPRLDELLKKARSQESTILHCPSDCMAAYVDHPARLRAMHTPRASNLPEEINQWCSKIPAEEKGVYPIDQSDGGEDDDPQEHAEWSAKLKALGRDPARPWKKQSDLITIDAEKDYITDRGEEVWNILEARGIKHVILAGVHVNMCVLGRPFGLRQMVRAGKQVALLRDMTDTMYNPARAPFVSHFTGTDLIISHIERFVCPTLTSDQFLGGQPFRFSGDKRPHLAIVTAEDEYETEKTLPEFASRYLGKDFRVSFAFGSETERNRIPYLEVLDEADVALISVRRRVLEPQQMAHVTKFLAAGKSAVGIRTASHAFSLRSESPPAGYVDFPEFDPQVWGGHYTNHYGAQFKPTIRIVPGAADNPILTGLPKEPFVSGGSLYKVTPLAERTVPLLTGEIADQPVEPVAWTFTRANGGKSFYTSLGFKTDFEGHPFVRLLFNGISWAAGLPVPKEFKMVSRSEWEQRAWTLVTVPSPSNGPAGSDVEVPLQPTWYRCVVFAPSAWDSRPLTLDVPHGHTRSEAWFNGNRLTEKATESGRTTYIVEPRWLEPGDANLIVLRFEKGGQGKEFTEAPTITDGSQAIELQGRWQYRAGDDPLWSNMPLPAKFGGSPDIVFP